MVATGMLHSHTDALLTLENTLRENSRPIAFLIGAGGGCSLRVEDEPLIPAIADLTKLVRDDLGPDVPELALLESTFVEDGWEVVTIEDWLSRLRTLKDIVGSQHARGLDLETIDRVESAIVKSVSERVAKDLPADVGGYDHLANWAAGFDRSNPVEIFTLSYDLLMEQAFERAQVAYFDGFLGSFQPFLDLRTMEEDNLPSRWARLWKMHGSINWRMEGGRAYRTSDWRGQYEGALIHPSHLKYDQSRRMPYLAMQDRLRAFMRQSGATLITIGYSFGDQHINELIEEGLRVNGGAVCFALMFDELTVSTAATEVAERVGNLRLYARDAGIIGGRRGQWRSNDDGEAPENVGDFNVLGRILAGLAENSK